MRSSPKNRKRQKRLDAISEALYKKNHHRVDDEGGAGPGPGSGELELRRSSRERRAPVVLDLSPAPPKKRRRRGVGRLSGERRVKEEEEEEEEEEGEGGWRTRLRARRGKKSGLFRKGKRKLFEEDDDEKEEEEEMESVSPKVVKSKRPGRVRATHGSENELVEVEEEVAGEEERDELMVTGCEEEKEDGGNERGAVEVDSTEENEVAELRENIDDEKVEAADIADCSKTVEQVESVDVVQEEDNVFGKATDDMIEEENEKHVEQEYASCSVAVNDQSEAAEGKGVPKNDVEVEVSCDANNKHFSKYDGKLATEGNNNMKDDMHKVGKSRIKVGRRCGLCRGGTNGVPPKILAQDMVDNENEAYGGSSDYEKFDYNIWDGFGDEPGWLGHLLGPVNDRYGIAGTWVHQNCAVWSPEV